LSVVALVENRLAIPAEAEQQIAVGFDHLRQAADIGVHILAIADEAGDVVLHYPRKRSTLELRVE